MRQEGQACNAFNLVADCPELDHMLPCLLEPMLNANPDAQHNTKPRMQNPRRPVDPAGDGVGARMTVEQLRTVVASLRTAVEFSRALAGAMPVLSQLLASSTLSDVQVTVRAQIRRASNLMVVHVIVRSQEENMHMADSEDVAEKGSSKVPSCRATPSVISSASMSYVHGHSEGCTCQIVPAIETVSRVGSHAAMRLQEAIAVLMACRRFGIHGADVTIRKMLPLVFSRDPGAARCAHSLLHAAQPPLLRVSTTVRFAGGVTS